MIKYKLNFFQVVLSLGFVALATLVIRVLDVPLTGTHKVRQADTLFTGYSYCIGDSSFLLPKIAHREATSGIAIGEFPLFSFLISLPCQITGTWSEIPPKLITYALWILNLCIWVLWFKRKVPRSAQLNPYAFLLFLGFSPLFLTYLLIPIPDALAMLSLGIAALLWQRPQRIFHLSGAIFFTLAFAIRPYLFPTLILLMPSWKTGAGAFLLCGLFYLIWFKYWIQHTQIWYYLTDTKPISSLVTNGWRPPLALIQQILLNHLNYIGLLPFALAVKKNKNYLLAWLLSIAFILILKGDHFVNHAYYFMATGLISVIAMAEGFLELSDKKQKIFAFFFVFMGLIAIQHNWRPLSHQRAITLPQLMEQNHVAFADRIAVYDTFNPQTLYFAKRVGWYFEKTDWKGPMTCPKEAKWALLFDSEDRPSLVQCINDL